jgi:choline dehydrogenase-like flavoprotein
MASNPLDSNAYLRRTMHRHADVVVVGAGVFGASMAITLARQSRSVFLLERSLKEPDRIVGELLQPGGIGALEKLGLQQCLDEIDSIPVKGYEVLYHSRSVSIPYPTDSLQVLGGKVRGEKGVHSTTVDSFKDCARLLQRNRTLQLSKQRWTESSRRNNRIRFWASRA